MKPKSPKESYVESINGVDFKMIFIPGGGHVIIKGRKITLPDFHLAETPCTQALWRAVMGSDPPDLYFRGDPRPVGNVSWLDIVGTSKTNNKAFLNELNKLSQQSNYKLPSEAMWLYAAQGGKTAEGFEYAGSNNLKEVGWYDTNSHSETKPVKLKLPNLLGIYDMSGNVWEWCADIWDEQAKRLPLDGMPNESGDQNVRSLRGGSWINYDFISRLARRDRGNTENHHNDGGFRVSRY